MALDPVLLILMLVGEVQIETGYLFVFKRGRGFTYKTVKGLMVKSREAQRGAGSRAGWKDRPHLNADKCQGGGVGREGGLPCHIPLCGLKARRKQTLEAAGRSP